MKNSISNNISHEVSLTDLSHLLGYQITESTWVRLISLAKHYGVDVSNELSFKKRVLAACWVRQYPQCQLNDVMKWLGIEVHSWPLVFEQALFIQLSGYHAAFIKAFPSQVAVSPILPHRWLQIVAIFRSNQLADSVLDIKSLLTTLCQFGKEGPLFENHALYQRFSMLNDRGVLFNIFRTLSDEERSVWRIDHTKKRISQPRGGQKEICLGFDQLRSLTLEQRQLLLPIWQKFTKRYNFTTWCCLVEIFLKKGSQPGVTWKQAVSGYAISYQSMCYIFGNENEMRHWADVLRVLGLENATEWEIVEERVQLRQRSKEYLLKSAQLAENIRQRQGGAVADLAQSSSSLQPGHHQAVNTEGMGLFNQMTNASSSSSMALGSSLPKSPSLLDALEPEEKRYNSWLTGHEHAKSANLRIPSVNGQDVSESVEPSVLTGQMQSQMKERSTVLRTLQLADNGQLTSRIKEGLPTKKAKTLPIQSGVAVALTQGASSLQQDSGSNQAIHARDAQVTSSSCSLVSPFSHNLPKPPSIWDASEPEVKQMDPWLVGVQHAKAAGLRGK